MITLRPNQEEPIRKAIEFFQQKRPNPSLIVLPTAWGKSILTAYVAKECRGTRLKDIPYDYLEWLLHNFKWTAKTEALRQSIIATMKN